MIMRLPWQLTEVNSECYSHLAGGGLLGARDSKGEPGRARACGGRESALQPLSGSLPLGLGNCPAAAGSSFPDGRASHCVPSVFVPPTLLPDYVGWG